MTAVIELEEQQRARKAQREEKRRKAAVKREPMKEAEALTDIPARLDV